MSKTIRLDDKVYDRLDAFLLHRETFSHGVERLLNIQDTMRTVSDTLGPAHYLKGSRLPLHETAAKSE